MSNSRPYQFYTGLVQVMVCFRPWLTITEVDLGHWAPSLGRRYRAPQQKARGRGALNFDLTQSATEIWKTEVHP